MIINGKEVHLKPCDGLKLVALHGTGTQGGKSRITGYFDKVKSTSDRSAFVKSECMNYGFGSPVRKPCYLYELDFFRGIKYSYCDEFKVEHKGCTATWRELSSKISELIEKGEYL